MLSQSRIAILLVAVIAAVEGFAPVAQPKVTSSTELGAFFFQKPTEKSPTLSLETESKNPFSKFSFGKKDTAKKAPVKKIAVKKPIAKKAPVKKAVVAKKPVAKKFGAKSTFKNDFVAKKPTKSKAKLTIYERQCHIN